MTRVLQIAAATLVLGAIALVAVWTRSPILAPSLASSAFAQILNPESDSAKPWSNGVGQLCGLAGGFAGVAAAQAAALPPFMAPHPLLYARVLAVVIAAAVAAALQVALKATSPAGGATAIVVAVGAETANLAGFERMLAGIVLVSALGEAARLAVLRSK